MFQDLGEGGGPFQRELVFLSGIQRISASLVSSSREELSPLPSAQFVSNVDSGREQFGNRDAYFSPCKYLAHPFDVTPLTNLGGKG